ncbi:MAG: DUF3747 domain-containing protein [Synechococcaceae cyanobacterium]|nr:DUF3747 domain-containing protein [Synechococcaceae cyanobacterium]
MAALSAALSCGLLTAWPQGAGASSGSLFEAAPLDLQRFVLVAAPIGSSGERAQLNIYEQVHPRRACFSIGEGKPSVVNPLLASFDFTGICGRYIDANGFSVRVGGTDLATSYRLMVSRNSQDTLLLAIPTRAGAGPEMIVARTQGAGGGFLKFELEPGWTLMRRAFRGRQLGHVYLYSPDWPGATAAVGTTGQAPAVPTTTTHGGPPVLPPALPATGARPTP